MFLPFGICTVRGPAMNLMHVVYLWDSCLHVSIVAWGWGCPEREEASPRQAPLVGQGRGRVQVCVAPVWQVTGEWLKHVNVASQAITVAAAQSLRWVTVTHTCGNVQHGTFLPFFLQYKVLHNICNTLLCNNLKYLCACMIERGRILWLSSLCCSQVRCYKIKWGI